jgi:hypothetical protein
MAEEEQQALGTAGELLAERRARRAAESAEAASARRAEAAEAIVRTLEAHLAILRQRLEEAAEDESNRPAPEPRLVIEPSPSGVRRRGDADRLPLAAESRWLDLDRRNRAEIDRLSRRLSDSERDTRGLAERLRGVQRELAASECLLERMRRGHRQLADLLREARAVTSQLRALTGEASTDAAPERFETQLDEARIRAFRLERENRAREGKPTAEASAAVLAADASRDPRADELDAALAVAVERLRARAAAGTRLESTAAAGSPQTSSTPVSMSPSREPLLAAPKRSWWAAWRARRRARRQR